MVVLETLPNPPIVEMVLDIDCDLPNADLATLEAPAHAAFQDRYPTAKHAMQQQVQFTQTSTEVRHGLQALQFVARDEKEIVQVRPQGFSFNRLAPYGKLDDYLPEIERTWSLFRQLAAPAQIRAIRLRYINRILLPISDPGLKLEEYLNLSPVPKVEGLLVGGFLAQHWAMEEASGHMVQTVLMTQALVDKALPLVFDNTAESRRNAEPDAPWASILSEITALRTLKNKVFRTMLTDECLRLFR